MMRHPIVIIGGDAAGMTAASKIKREQPDRHVIVFERGQDISYSACGMPYWIGGIVASADALVALTLARAEQERGIDVRLGHTVVAIERASKTVVVQNQASGERFHQPYDQLLIATGARATKPALSGVDLPNVFLLRSLADARAIHTAVTTQAPKQAVILGGGYIGLEMAEALHARGLAVTLIQRSGQLMTDFDAEMIAPVTAHLVEQGVQVMLSTRVQAIAQRGTQLSLQLEAGEPLPADLVILATGVQANSELAAAAGLRIGETGAIWVDAQMRTSDPDIFAAGDCVEHYHLILSKNAYIPLATSASKGGRIAGDNMSGGAATFVGIVGTTIVKAFDYTLAITGLSEAAARQSGQFGERGEYIGATTIQSTDKAGYYPGSEALQVKLVYDRRDGRLLGGQLVGRAGVNKRIDIVATALHARMTVMQIGWLDLSYAPPYSTTWDPIQVAANVATKAVTGRE